jgi:hypothetical protein
MVSNFPSLYVAPDELGPHSAPTAEVEGFGERMMDLIRETFCGLHGHDNLLQFKHDRMFLKCASCGHESPGWELNETPPTLAARSRPQSLMRPQLLSDRRIA